MADKNQGKISGTWNTWDRPTLLPSLFVPVQPKNTDGTTKIHAHERVRLSVLTKSIYIHSMVYAMNYWPFSIGFHLYNMPEFH